MTKQEIENIKNKLNTQRLTGDARYKDAFLRGLAGAKAVLDRCEGMTPDYALAELRIRLHNPPPYPSDNKAEAYANAIRAAMSIIRERHPQY